MGGTGIEGQLFKVKYRELTKGILIKGKGVSGKIHGSRRVCYKHRKNEKDNLCIGRRDPGGR